MGYNYENNFNWETRTIVNRRTARGWSAGRQRENGVRFWNEESSHAIMSINWNVYLFLWSTWYTISVQKTLLKQWQNSIIIERWQIGLQMKKHNLILHIFSQFISDSSLCRSSLSQTESSSELISQMYSYT